MGRLTQQAHPAGYRYLRASASPIRLAGGGGRAGGQWAGVTGVLAALQGWARLPYGDPRGSAPPSRECAALPRVRLALAWQIPAGSPPAASGRRI
ncbi:hypothetical protein N8T08_001889 [Aspergillus melleus]|uniref:Uncharacterized protein n=1 Tax=Aspergillus melleus TaxID=138277 RepID=A0ACC3B9W6_9EURO|nr:hypothetical protein N8T08_001889 [Aspergillus melleus]